MMDDESALHNSEVRRALDQDNKGSSTQQQTDYNQSISQINEENRNSRAVTDGEENSKPIQQSDIHFNNNLNVPNDITENSLTQGTAKSGNFAFPFDSFKSNTAETVGNQINFGSFVDSAQTDSSNSTSFSFPTSNNKNEAENNASFSFFGGFVDQSKSENEKKNELSFTFPSDSAPKLDKNQAEFSIGAFSDAAISPDEIKRETSSSEIENENENEKKLFESNSGTNKNSNVDFGVSSIDDSDFLPISSAIQSLTDNTNTKVGVAELGNADFLPISSQLQIPNQNSNIINEININEAKNNSNKNIYENNNQNNIQNSAQNNGGNNGYNDNKANDVELHPRGRSASGIVELDDSDFLPISNIQNIDSNGVAEINESDFRPISDIMNKESKGVTEIDDSDFKPFNPEITKVENGQISKDNNVIENENLNSSPKITDEEFEIVQKSSQRRQSVTDLDDSDFLPVSVHLQGAVKPEDAKNDNVNNNNNNGGFTFDFNSSKTQINDNKDNNNVANEFSFTFPTENFDISNKSNNDINNSFSFSFKDEDSEIKNVEQNKDINSPFAFQSASSQRDPKSEQNISNGLGFGFSDSAAVGAAAAVGASQQNETVSPEPNNAPFNNPFIENTKQVQKIGEENNTNTNPFEISFKDNSNNDQEITPKQDSAFSLKNNPFGVQPTNNSISTNPFDDKPQNPFENKPQNPFENKPQNPFENKPQNPIENKPINPFADQPNNENVTKNPFEVANDASNKQPQGQKVNPFDTDSSQKALPKSELLQKATQQPNSRKSQPAPSGAFTPFVFPTGNFTPFANSNSNNSFSQPSEVASSEFKVSEFIELLSSPIFAQQTFDSTEAFFNTNDPNDSDEACYSLLFAELRQNRQ